MNVNKLEWFLDMDPIDPGTDIRVKWGWNGKERIPNQLIAQLCGQRDKQRDDLAKFIIRACNSHTDLLEACKEAYASLEQLRRLGDKQDWEGYQPLHKAYEMTKAAIQKAEGVS